MSRAIMPSCSLAVRPRRACAQGGSGGLGVPSAPPGKQGGLGGGTPPNGVSQFWDPASLGDPPPRGQGIRDIWRQSTANFRRQGSAWFRTQSYLPAQLVDLLFLLFLQALLFHQARLFLLALLNSFGLLKLPSKPRPWHNTSVALSLRRPRHLFCGFLCIGFE